jgi:hemolysin activation/secretion protein
VNGSFEFYSPNFGAYGLDYVDELRVMAFSDLARLWIKDPLPGTPSSYDLFSVGTGLRMQVLRKLIGELYWAYPFVATEYVKVGESRIDFRVAYEF